MKSITAGERIMVLYVLLAIFLLLSCDAIADGIDIQVSDPTGNVNPSPFQQRESANQCLQNQNTSKSCIDKYQLSEGGWGNVTQTDTGEYCNPGGCAAHTRAVLLCIHEVKRDYMFIDKTSVQDLNMTITMGCDYGFNGSAVISSAQRSFQSKSALIFSSVPALFLVTYFNM